MKSNKGVNLPGANLAIPVLTPKDREDLRFGLDKGVDMVAISFVKEASDIEMVRQAIHENASNEREENTNYREIGTPRSH